MLSFQHSNSPLFITCNMTEEILTKYSQTGQKLKPAQPLPAALECYL